METDTDGYSLGEEVTPRIRVRRPAGIVVSTRLERDIADRLLEVSDASGKSLSQLVREAVLLSLERPAHGGSPPMGTHFSMGTAGGHLNAVSSARNSVVTSSGLADHAERLLEVG